MCKKTLQQKHFQFFNLKLYFNKEQFSNDAVISKEFASKNHFFTYSLFFSIFILQSWKKIQEKLKISCDIATKGKIAEY